MVRVGEQRALRVVSPSPSQRYLPPPPLLRSRNLDDLKLCYGIGRVPFSG